jgi:phage baseplate assembly protein W
MTHVRFPLRFDGRGRTADADDDRHIVDLIEQVLLTGPGERVMRPTFGSGVLQLVFGANSPEIAATTQFLIQGALQQWLGEVIAVDAVDVDAQDSTLLIQIRYVNRRTLVRNVATIRAPR